MRRFTGILSLTAALAMIPVAGTTAAEWHVAIRGNDGNTGDAQSPLRTIQRAADLARPGDVITVYEGIYRERVNPPRGGESDAKRIVYQAAPGEAVEIKGSEVVTNWVCLGGDTWTTVLSNSFFGTFNPYKDVIKGDWFDARGRKHHTGAVYLRGEWLAEAAQREEVFKPRGKVPLWFGEVDATNTTLWAQFPGADPNAGGVEINVRQSVFYPDQPGRNYITVRGFAMRQAATPWAPPTFEQIGLLGVNWSKGWIVESNTISHSICSGITLGKYGDANDCNWDYSKTIARALSNGWSKASVGGHLVRDNHISHCEQAGICGSMGGAFSRITGNTVHDIHVRSVFGGCEMAGIKFHGAIDSEIIGNHVYRTNRGLWLDWMTQGTRVSRNLFHDNGQDLFVEVNHGPFLVDNNVFLSAFSLNNRSHGGAYVHNLFGGILDIVSADNRVTPYHKPHATEVAGQTNYVAGDDRWYNNLFVCYRHRPDLGAYDNARMPVWMGGNVFFGKAAPSRQEQAPLVHTNFNPAVKLELADGARLTMALVPGWDGTRARRLVTTELLGRAAIPKAAYENPDGTPLKVDYDFFGNPRSITSPTPGPFEKPGGGKIDLVLLGRQVACGDVRY